MHKSYSVHLRNGADPAHELMPQQMEPSPSFTEFPKDSINQSIPERFEFIANRYPSRLALTFGSTTLCYADLNREANRVARAIINVQKSDSPTVAMLLPQGAALVKTILGILKASSAYLGLDPSYPTSRLNFMLEDSEAGVLITDDANFETAEKLASSNIEVLNIESLDDHIDDDNLTLKIDPDSLAYIFYTSGSTGRPKGVYDCHRNVLHNVMRYTNTLRISPDDRLTLLQSSSFSGSVSSLFGALLNGACTFPFDLHLMSPKLLAGWLRDNKISIYHSVPAIFRSLFAEDGSFPDIRIVRLEGDQASNLDVRLFQQHFSSGCLLVNGLGTTETGLVSQYFVDQNSKVSGSILPVGYSVQDMQILILDDEGIELARGTVGEIAVRSQYLAHGYWNNKQLTELRFVPDTNNPGLRTYLTGDIGRLDVDGELTHLGRIAGRQKIRGHTIEFAEVEMALLNLESVSETVVASYEHGTHGERLAAYFVPTHLPGPTISEIRQELLETLPDYAIPSSFVALDKLPRNLSGKIDLKALPHPGNTRPNLDVEYVPAQSLAQLQLIQIWEQILRIHPIGIRDDFFDLGGDSLLVLNVLMHVDEVFGINIPATALFPDATVEELAFLIQSQDQHLCKPVVEIQAGSSGPPLFFLHGDYLSGGFYCLNLASHLDEDIPFYALPPCGFDGGEMPASYGDMADRHIAALRQIQPEGPYNLGGTCNGGMVAYEIARRLKSQGEDVTMLALFFASAANQRFRPLFRFVTSIGSFLNYSEDQRRAAFLRLREIAVAVESRTVPQQISYLLRKIFLLPREFFGLLRPKRTTWAQTSSHEEMSAVYHAVDHLYMPGSYAGKVTLLWPTGEPETADQAAAEWRRVAKEVELRTLASSHYSCLTQDAVLLAEELTASYLEAVQCD